MKRHLIALIIALLATAPAAVAQAPYRTDAATCLQRGKAMYETGNYAGCADVMRDLLRRPDARPLQEEIEYYIAMSCVKSGNDRVPAMLTAFMERYPHSRHRARVCMAQGDYYYYAHRYDKAVEVYRTIDLDELQPYMRDDWCYRLATSYMQTSEPSRALPLFNALVQNSATYRNEARYYVGYILYHEGKYAEARRSLMQVPSTSAYGEEARFLLVEIDFTEKKYAQVVAQSERILDDCTRDDHRTELHRLAGESYFVLGNTEQAHTHLNEYLATTATPERNALYMAGMTAYDRGDYDEAVERLNRTIEPDDALTQNAYLHIGLCYLRDHDTRSAGLAFERAASYRHDDMVRETALYNHALCAYESNFAMFDSNIALFEQFLDEYPRSIYADDINSRLADLYVNSRNYRTALASIDRIKQPSRPLLAARQQILYMLGTEAFADNRIAHAGDLFAQAVKMGSYAPEYRARSLYWLGECCYRQGAYDKALKCYRGFLKANITTDATTVSLAHYNIAYCHFEQKAYNEAIASFDTFTKRRGTDRLLQIDALNRLGDCYYYGRSYTKAEDYYSRAAQMNDTGSDYALLQQAVVAGVNKKNNRKLQLLLTLVERYPASEYIQEAYTQLAQTYVQLNKPQQAIEAYKHLTDGNSRSAAARQAALQQGIIYYNMGNVAQSIAAYKQVIAQYPTSREAKMAAEDLKTIYIEEDRVDELTAFMQSQGYRYETAAVDSLYYLAAERSYMRNNNTASLEQYVARYPNGAFAARAHYYIAGNAFGKKSYDTALAHYTTALQLSPDADFAEDALARRCEILYMRNQYDEALTAFTSLNARATSTVNRRAARQGMLRCAVALRRHDVTIEAAGLLLADSKLSPELKQEALYSRATAHRLSGNSGAAADDYLSLAADTRSEYGAEGAYRVAQFYYDSGEYNKAEQAANKLIDAGTPHAYWLARGIILLSDVYATTGDAFKARQYLTSLQDNYPGGDDDIASLIASRLEKL